MDTDTDTEPPASPHLLARVDEDDDPSPEVRLEEGPHDVELGVRLHHQVPLGQLGRRGVPRRLVDREVLGTAQTQTHKLTH